MKDKEKNNENFKSTSMNAVFKRLDSSKNGLTSTEAENRLKKYGVNSIAEKKINPIIKFLSYFWGPIPWMIISALIISAVIGNWEDFLIILLLLFVNVMVGFWQEYKAGNAIELLKQKLAINAKVLRDKKWISVPSNLLVPGDVIQVRLGDIIPADIKLFDDSYLLVDESSLTGESLPVDKISSDVSYSGTIVRKGETNALVIATGQDTFFGKTAKLVEQGKTKSHFQKALIKIGNYLIKIAIILVAAVFVVSLLRQENFADTLQFTLVLAVAAIPVALPAVLSVSMAVGAHTLTKKQAIVSRLASIEEMAGMDILCSDKTGTLTKNILTIETPVPLNQYSDDDVLLYAALASKDEDKDPIDKVITERIIKDQTLSNRLDLFVKKKFVPFDPVVKRSESVIESNDGRTFKVSKGAVQVMLALIENKNDGIIDEIKEKIEMLAVQGYRTLGVCKTDDDGFWQFVGIVPLFDPLREDSSQIITTAKSLGIKIKMLTGDHISIAKQVANKIGLGTTILRATDLTDGFSNLNKTIENVDGFAQVFPEHKYKIVDALQGHDHIVGMTGDGVNDAPALKKADVGIAVNNATDAAKSAADVVLTDSGISVIIDAIKESRRVFQRMKNYAIYRIGETIRILLFLTAAIIAFNFYPVTAIMIVLLALLNDIPIMTIAFDNVHYSKIPERWNMRNIMIISAILGGVGVVSSFTLLYIGKEIFLLSAETIQSLIYLKLSVAGHMFLFVARTRRNFWTVRPSPYLFLAVISTQIIATLIAVYGIIITPIGWNLAVFVWIYSGMWFFITDFGKILLYRFIKP